MSETEAHEFSEEAMLLRIAQREKLVCARLWAGTSLGAVGAVAIAERFLLRPAARGAFIVTGIAGALLMFWLWRGALRLVQPIARYPFTLDGHRSPFRWWLRTVGLLADLATRLIAGVTLAIAVQYAPALALNVGWTPEPFSTAQQILGVHIPVLADLAFEELKDLCVVAVLASLIGYLPSRLSSADLPRFAAWGEPSDRELLAVMLIVIGLSLPMAVNAVACFVHVMGQLRYAAHVVVQSTLLVGSFVGFVVTYRARWRSVRYRPERGTGGGGSATTSGTV